MSESTHKIDWLQGLGDGQVLSLKAGDIIVVRSQRQLTPYQRTFIKEQVARLTGIQVMVLDAGMELGVLRDDS